LETEAEGTGVGIGLVGVNGTSAITTRWKRELEIVVEDGLDTIVGTTFSQLDEAETPGSPGNRVVHLAQCGPFLSGGRRIRLEVDNVRVGCL
jgi:hypothetical protein